MFRLVTLALALVGASAFAPVSKPVARTAPMNVAVEEMAGVQDPVGLFDPMGLATSGNDETLLWFRAAELKHSRVTMLATAGWLVNSAGIYFPGELTHGTKFSDLGAKPLEAWAAVPFAGKFQILLFAGAVEFFSEVKKPHYMKGGPMGLQCDPLGLYENMSEDMRKTRMNRELANGRLAMIGIMSFIAAAKVPGSVPAIPAAFNIN
eukprot:CAMPEP_0205904706 /NCGR_PEP_ID=MMETSP1325-20131115/893_1 /ASSEMBLY_ACC=CAM_ASM_000708 /TAXON_ID=236786 /ORGANISM="Florenciella sp., Strain RCC1007" /LENGTH=206 /DNA_ID=CAMNT_0053270523 /DNA_START=24 /DNA_END=644 /DNA_ORIENTATION=+